MPIISYFPSVGGAGGGGVALGAVSNISTIVSHGKAYFKWTDPDDIVVDGTALAEFAGTILVRKAGSMPVSRRDGTIVLDSTVRNQYQDAYFCDSGLTDGVTYYYKFFPYTTTNTYTKSEDCEFSAVPTAQVEGIDSWNVTNMAASSEAGDGKMTIRWTDPAATITSDGVTLATWASTTVVVKEGSYPTGKDDADAVFSQKVTIHNQYSSSPLTVTGLTNGTTYYIAFFPETADGGINTNTVQRTTGVANKITISTVPSQSDRLTYTGSAQTPSWSNYDSTKMTLSVIAQTNAGTYSASFTPTSDYRWGDGSTTFKSVYWTIDKAVGYLRLSKSSVTLNADDKSAMVTVTRAGNGTIIAESSDTSVATVSVSGTTLTISSVNDTAGTATITVRVAASTNHTTPSNKTISVSCEFLPPVGTALNDCSWEDISKIASDGLASLYWAVGDTKAITVSGTVGTLSVSGTYYVYILGFDHNGATDTIDFGTFKTALTGGTDICLIDSNYNNDSYNGTMYFNLNHWGTTKSPYNTNYGGWKGCDARYDILGSTDTAPSGYGSTATTSRTGYDASTTCATNPVANTLMAALPADLRAVMKPMTVYTDNVGNSSNTAAGVSSSVDYLPLLAEFEIFGTRTFANTYEQNYQAQYDYYANGNSKVKYQHSSTGSAVYWRERSTFYNSSSSFCYVYTNGNGGRYDSLRSYGLAPVFRV